MCAWLVHQSVMVCQYALVTLTYRTPSCLMLCTAQVLKEASPHDSPVRSQ